MLGRPAAKVCLSPEVRARLEVRLRSGRCTLAEQRRARIALLSADGTMTSSIAKELDIEPSTVSRWRGRFAREGISEDVLEDLSDAPRSGRPPTIAPTTRMQVVAIACDPLPDAQGELSGWTLDLLVEELPLRGIEGVSRSSIQRILTQNEVKPHRCEMWLHSPDPRFVEKIDEIVPLYLKCPPGSVVLSFDEKTGMQAVERKHPDRPPRPGRLARHEFEYIRHGTQHPHRDCCGRDQCLLGDTSGRHDLQVREGRRHQDRHRDGTDVAVYRRDRLDERLLHLVRNERRDL